MQLTYDGPENFQAVAAYGSQGDIRKYHGVGATPTEAYADLANRLEAACQSLYDDWQFLSREINEERERP